MANKHLRLAPVNLSNNVWFYEESGGMVLVVDFGTGIDQFKISWRRLRAMIERKDRTDSDGGEDE
jgi:hypothetical protein